MQGSQNLKVGFLFLLFLALLFWATLMVKGGIQGIFPSGRILVAKFDSVEGLKKGDKVLFAGVPVGKVTEVEFHADYMLVHMLIQQDDVKVYRGAVVEAEDISTLGGKQISISRGDRLLGEINWKEIQLATAKPPLSEAVQNVAGTLNDFVDENRKGFNAVIENLKQTTDNLREVSERVNAGKGTAGKFLNDPSLYDNLNSVAGNANTLISSIVEGKGSIGPLFNRPEIYERIEFITRQMVSGRGVLGQLLVNETLYNNMEGVVINVERITRSVAEGRGTLGRLVNDPDLYDNIDAIVGRMNRGEGTLGKLLTDEVLYNEVRDVVSNLKGVARSFESVARKMDKGRGSV
ncbi:MAG: MlaD family protein, partial [Planctomycetota bacterium]